MFTLAVATVVAAFAGFVAAQESHQVAVRRLSDTAGSLTLMVFVHATIDDQQLWIRQPRLPV
jgi:hypothetical protein